MSAWSKRVAALDAADPLADIRNAFDLPTKSIYLDGNSLGALPHAVKARLQTVVQEQWGRDLIGSWNKHNWINLAQSVGAKIAPLLGTTSEQVIVCDSISVNLFKLLNIALTERPERSKILSTHNNFPTDLYVAQGIQALLGDARCKLVTVEPSKLEQHLDKEVAVLMLTQVDFRSGAMLDIQAITRKAHACGALVIWDLAHSAGVVPLQLNAWDVDFAVGCGYKYLNGGPGAPAFISVGEQYITKLSQPIQGWMGHAQPFEFKPNYEPANTAKQLLTGTPPILSLAALDAAMDVYADVSVAELRQKSLSLSGLFIELFDAWQERYPEEMNGFNLAARLNAEERGSHIAIERYDAYPISQALLAHNVIIDFRAPNLIRFGFAPLYNSHQDVLKSILVLHQIMQHGTFRDPVYQQRKRVT